MKKTLKKIGFIVLVVCMLMSLMSVSAVAASGFDGHLNVKALCDVCRITVNGKTYDITAYVDKNTLKVTANGTTFDFAEGDTTGEVSGLAEHVYRNAGLPEGLDVNTFFVECDVILDAGQVSLYGLDFVLEKSSDGLVHIPYAGYYDGINECTNGLGLRSRHDALPWTCPYYYIYHEDCCKCPITGYDLYLNVAKNLDPAEPEKELYTLTYDENGGEGGPDDVVDLPAQKGYALADTPVPTHADVDGSKVKFLGWTAEKTDKLFAEKDELPEIITTVDIEGDTTVYAAWGYESEAVDPGKVTYTLTFETNGGTEVDSVEAESGTVIDLKQYTTTKDGYKFLGWYADEELTEAVDSVTLIKDTTVYAKWEKISDNNNSGGNNNGGNNNSGSSNTPSTGDTSYTVLLSVIAALSVLCAAAVVFARKKLRRN